MDKAPKQNPILKDDEPAKGGIEKPQPKPYPSGDSPKPHGDKLEDAVEDVVKKKP